MKPRDRVRSLIRFCAGTCTAVALGLSSASAVDSGSELRPLSPQRATLELHAHLFMKEGMTWGFRGDFDGPLKAESWTDRFSSQANPEAMDRSELGVVVVALYANPFFTINLRESIRRQIRQAEQFVAAHSEWMIARSAGEARAALDGGRRVLVLALEGASGIIETEEDLKEFVDDKGIRIVNLLHLTDDIYGGVAFEPGFKVLSSPWAWVTQLLSPTRGPDGIKINAHGLTDQGREMARKLMARHVWIDLAHASDYSQRELVALYEKEGLPLLYTHTTLRSHMGAERGITLEQADLVRKTGGVLGLMPADDMLGPTPVPPGSPVRCNCPGPCAGGWVSLAEQYWELSSHLSPEQIALGSDYNGGVHHLPPACGTGTALDQKGLWNIGLQGAVWDALQGTGLPVPSPRRKMIDHFLGAWEKINPTASPASKGTRS